MAGEWGDSTWGSNTWGGTNVTVALTGVSARGLPVQLPLAALKQLPATLLVVLRAR